MLFIAEVVAVWDVIYRENGDFNKGLQISLDWREKESCNVAQMCSLLQTVNEFIDASVVCL